MRLHHLEVRAFGPFAGEEHVDFDALTSSGLFLLCGPTGAGKTSVLDAVCFALFGQVAGERDKAKRLHSDHAGTGRGPRVVLEVSMRGRRLRISRSPEWMRPKKRGTGEIKEHAKVLVEERVGGDWEQRSSRVDEAADFVGRLLGLTMSQFCQVALLPQGRFETFLRSGAQERHTLLEKLFGTHRFRAAEEWLSEHRRGLAVQSAEHAERVTGTLERMAEASGRPGPGGPDPETVQEWGSGVCAEALAELTEASQARAAADQEAKDARTALDAAHELAHLQGLHRDAVRRDADLRALADSTRRLRQRVERARRAEVVHPFVQIHEATGHRAEQASDALHCARASVLEADPAVPAPSGGVDDDPAVVAAAVRQQQREVARLEELLPVEHQVCELDAELAELHGRLESIEAERRAQETETTRLRDASGPVLAAQSAASAAAARLGYLREGLTRAEEVARAAAEVPTRERRRRELAEAREHAAGVAHGAREAWLDLRQARLDGMAGELARGLDDGRPCPVCGSADHPDPAATDAAAVSAEAEQAAERAWQEAEDDRRRHTDELSCCERELAELRTAADGADPATAASRLAGARAELGEAEACVSRAEPLAAKLASIDAALEQTQRHAHALATAHAQLAERDSQLTGRRDDLLARLEAATGGCTRVSEHLAERRRLTRRWERLHECLREHVDAAGAHDQAAQRLHRAVAEAGFDDVEEVRAARLSDTEVSSAETLLRTRDEQAAQVRAVLEDPRMQEAAALPGVDLDPAVQRVEQAERRRDAAVAAEHTCEHRARRLDELLAELERALAAWAPVRASLTVAERMASLCAGTSADNRHKMRLSAYVLAARLEQVVAAANERLLRMSSGRYTLRHSVARGVGDRRGGLGLLVHDGWTGELRDPATLSGGETFFTSLALALGLADVVTHEAGGTEIDTLFVDEGFGSLDPDTLDEVMDVLDQLRTGGRAVGIVSHVSDLRARVPAQVHVHKSRAGSTLSCA